MNAQSKGGLWAPLKRIGFSAAIAVAVAIPLALAALSLNYASTFVDRKPIRAHLTLAFKEGHLRENAGQITLLRRGFDQWNDCVVLLMVLDDQGTRLERALSPRWHFTDEHFACEALKLQLEGRPIQTEPYNRYLQGLTAMAAPVMALTTLGVARVWLEGMIVFLTAALLAAAAVRTMRAARRQARDEARRALFAGVAAVFLLCFFGLGGFGMAFTHFPTAVVLTGYLWAHLFVDFGRLSPAKLAVAQALFGVLIAWFEFLTGGAPLGACLLLYMAAAWARLDQGLTAAASSLAAYGAGFVTAFAVKLPVSAMVFGPAVWGDFAAGLGHRLAGGAGYDLPEVRPLDAARNLYWQSGYIGAGSEALGKLMIVLAVLALAWGTVVVVRRRAAAGEAMRPLLLIAAAGAIGAWHLAFYPHSYGHAWVMVRTFTGLFICAAMLMVWLYRRPIADIITQLAALTRR